MPRGGVEERRRGGGMSRQRRRVMAQRFDGRSAASRKWRLPYTLPLVRGAYRGRLFVRGGRESRCRLFPSQDGAGEEVGGRRDHGGGGSPASTSRRRRRWTRRAMRRATTPPRAPPARSPTRTGRNSTIGTPKARG